MRCRFCNSNHLQNLVDLGYAPPSNAYIEIKDKNKPEIYFPLKVNICSECFLAQTEDFTKAEDLFTPNYAYFSSNSSTLLKHSKNYVNMIEDYLKLNEKSFVVEIASNDGYLLKNFVNKKIPCLGIEPAVETALHAEKLNITVEKKFFSYKNSKYIHKKYNKADLIIGNNVYAHVPDIKDFTKGLKNLLKDEGTITLEFPSLMNLIKYNQFDTIYHEHFSYLSLISVKKIFNSVGLKIYNIQKIKTHGGSLRIFGCHEESGKVIDTSVEEILSEEEIFGINNLDIYKSFQDKVEKIKNQFLNFLLEAKKEDKKVGAYGAAAKANTIINYAGIKKDLIPFIIDNSMAKQNKFLPGSHIKIISPEKLENLKLDYLIIFPWNLLDEIKNQNKFIKRNGTKLITLIPELKIHEPEV